MTNQVPMFPSDHPLNGDDEDAIQAWLADNTREGFNFVLTLTLDVGFSWKEHDALVEALPALKAARDNSITVSAPIVFAFDASQALRRKIEHHVGPLIDGSQVAVTPRLYATLRFAVERTFMGHGEEALAAMRGERFSDLFRTTIGELHHAFARLDRHAGANPQLTLTVLAVGKD